MAPLLFSCTCTRASWLCVCACVWDCVCVPPFIYVRKCVCVSLCWSRPELVPQRFLCQQWSLKLYIIINLGLVPTHSHPVFLYFNALCVHCVWFLSECCSVQSAAVCVRPFHFCGVLSEAPFGGDGHISFVWGGGWNPTAQFSCGTLTFQYLVAPLLPSKYYTCSCSLGYRFCVIPGRSKHTHARTHTHTHTHRHAQRFQISPSALRGSDCFTGNRVTGQMIELLMEVRCNNNRPLSIVIPTWYSQSPLQPNLILPCYDPNPIMQSLQKNVSPPSSPPPPRGSFIVSSVEKVSLVCCLHSGEHYRVCRTISTAVPHFQGRAMHFHQNCHGKVIHCDGTLSQYTGLWKLCVLLCIYICVCACDSL